MKDYKDMTLSELEAAKKKMLIKELAESEKEKNTHVGGEVPIVQNLDMGKNAGNSYSEYLKRYIGDEEPFIYANSDSGCDTDVSAWSPSENFVAGVWHTVYSKSKLLGVANVGFNVQMGEGNRVDIRTLSKLEAPSEMSACECNSCSSNTLGKYSIELKQYSLGITECNFEIYDVGYDLYSKQIQAMGFRYAEFFDAQLYSELDTATAGYTVDLANAISLTPSTVSTSCCEDTSLFDLYNAVLDGVAQMREADYSPDIMIISPSVGNILKRMSGIAVSAWANAIIHLGANGEITHFNGLRVIETSAANAASASSDVHLAIIIDSSRALGAAFGRKPFLLTEQSASCNSVEAFMWCYFNAAELDTGAICHIENP